MMANSLPAGNLGSHDVHIASTSSHCLHSKRNHNGITTTLANEDSVPSVLHPGETALPIGTLFGQDHAAPSNSISDTSTHYNHGSAPADGEQVWYCSACGDGPISGWQNVCVVCSHQQCGSCTFEEI